MAEDDSFGAVLRRWRRVRGLSQMELALRARTTPRHLSFLETGRSRATETMIDRLSAVLKLDAAARDALRFAAGFAVKAPPSGAEGDADFASALFETTLALKRASTPASLIALSEPLRQSLGMTHCFFATARRGGVEFANHGGMPASWLARYQRRHYAAIDPFVSGTLAARSLLWDKAPVAGSALFRDAAAVGIRAGAIAQVRGDDGAVHMVSMMGAGPARHDARARLGLQTLGHIMLDQYLALR